MWLAGHRKMLGLERIRITGGNAKFGTINSHSCSLVFVWGEKGLAPFFLSLHFFTLQVVFHEDSEPKDVFTKVFPRFMAIAERMWGGWAWRSDGVRVGEFG